MTEFQVLYWFNIPTGVKARDDEGTVRRELHIRHQNAVDAVATATGRTGTQEYLAGWTWSDPKTRPGSAVDVAEQVVDELESSYPPDRLREMKQELIESPGSAETPRGKGRREAQV
jgi:hypothetical protein